MAEITVYDKLYVTVEHRPDAKSDTGHLGFSSPYTKDAAFHRRKDTQDQWAYGRGTNWVIDDEDQITSGEGHTSKVDMIALFVTQAYPRIVVNEPREGFEIAKSVRRYGYRGPGNVLWRITDPAGYDLEISSENFASIVDHCVLEQGVIKGRCVWGRDGSKNVLLPEGSEPYDKALKFTKQKKNSVSLKDVKLGDTVEILNKGMIGIPFTYLGKMFIHCVENLHTEGDSYYSDNRGADFKAKTCERYVLINETTGALTAISAPKVAEVTKTRPYPLVTRDEALRIVNETPQSSMDGIFDQFSFVSATKDPTDYSFIVKEIPYETAFDGASYRKHQQHYDALMLANYDDKWYTCFSSRNYNRNGTTNEPRLIELDTVPYGARSDMRTEGRMVQNDNHWSRHYTWKPNVIDAPPATANAKYYTLAVELGDYTRDLGCFTQMVPA